MINLLVIYRYPNTSVISFYNYLADTLENNIHALKGHCKLTGNFNIHTEDALDNDTRSFHDMLDSLGMVNHVTFPTSKQGHTLDLVIEEEDSPHVVKVTKCHLISDHHFIHAYISVHKNNPKEMEVAYRKYKQIDKTMFKEDLQRTLEVEHTTLDLRSLVEKYNSNLKEVLDRHAPEKKETS